MIRNVLIYSDQSASMAAEKINSALTKYQDEDTEVAYELFIENSAMVGSMNVTKYTGLIEVSDKDDAA